MDLVSARFWLTGVNYLQEKRAIVLHFSWLNNRRTAKLPFFPCFYASKAFFSLQQLHQALSGEGKRFKIEEKPRAFKVSAATFSGLNALADRIFNETGFRPLMLNPERQFLLERNWSYFDCFVFFGGKEFAKSERFSFPEARLGFFSEPLRETVQQLAREDLQAAQKTLEAIALSSLLHLPIEVLPGTGFMQLEAFFETIFWKAGLCAKKPGQGAFLAESPALPMLKDGLAEVDFSRVFSMLLARPFYNLGPDSIDCGCCRPASSAEKNVLPSTLMLVEMQQDGFFFESNSGSFAKSFHEKSNGKESRLRRMREFCLNAVPLGPFFRKQVVAVPLLDAASLQAAKKAKVLQPERLHWFCLKKESNVSKAVYSLNESIALLEMACNEMQRNAVKEHGILGCSAVAQAPEFLLKQSFLEALSVLLSSIGKHLCDERSAFFRKSTCLAVEAIESGLLNGFKRFASRGESRVVAFGRAKAVVRSDEPNLLFKRFAEEQQIAAVLKVRGK